MTVIRDAVIQLRIEQKRAKIEVPDTSASQRAFEAEAKAAEQSTEAIAARNAEYERSMVGLRQFTDQLRRNMAEAESATENYERISVNSFRQSGEGVVRLVRGFALFAASGEEDTQRVLEGIIKIEAALSTFRGAAKLAEVAAAFGPVGVAVAGVTTLVAAGAVEWSSYRREMEAARKAAEETQETLNRQKREFESNRATVRESDATAAIVNRSRFTDIAQSEAEQRRRITAEQSFLQERFDKFNNREFAPATSKNREQTLVSERERERIGERLLELSQRQLQLDLAKIQREEEAARQNAIKFTVPGTNIKVNTFSEQAFQQRETELQQRTERAMTAIVESIEEASERIRKIEIGTSY